MKKTTWLSLLIASALALAPAPALAQGGWFTQNNGQRLRVTTANNLSAVTIQNTNTSGCTLTLVSGASTTALSVCGTAVTFGGNVTLASTATLGWSDVILVRDAANTLALRNGTNAQAFNVYETYTDASNYERLRIRMSGSNSAIIETTSAGTGSNLSMVVGTVDTGTVTVKIANTNRWQWDTSGNYIAVADNAYDIGASGATRPRTVYVGTSVVSPAYTFNGTTGKTGTTCTAFTVGGCTTATEPADYVTNYLSPWFDQAGYKLVTSQEWQSLLSRLSALESARR